MKSANVRCTRNTCAKAIAVLGSCAVSLFAHAASPDLAYASDVINKYAADLSIPESPAASALGLSQGAVVAPKDVRAFGASLLNLAGARGGNGAAFEVSPMLLFAGTSYTVGEYQKSLGLQAAIRTSLGLAVGKKTIASNDYSGYSLSISTVLIDRGDAALDNELQTCINKAQATVLAQVPLTPPKESKPKKAGTEDTAISENLDAADEIESPVFAGAVALCFKSAKARNWNRSKLAVGLWSTHLTPSTSNLPEAKGGTTAWITLAYGFDSFREQFSSDDLKKAAKSDKFTDRLAANAQWLFHYRATRNASDLGSLAGGAFPDFKSDLLATRFTYGSESNATFLELSQTRMNSAGVQNASKGLVIGSSFKVAKDTWFSIALGKRREFASDKDTPVATMSLKFGSSSESIPLKR